MTTTLTALQQQRRDTAANWTFNNPTLLAGELGYESDTGKWKVGDGGTAWNALAYIPSTEINSYPFVNADIAANAEIAVSKLADGAARQLLQTDAGGTGVEWTDNVDVPGTLDVTGAATFDAAVTIQGDLTVNGTTTTIDTQHLIVEDKNVVIGQVTSPTDVTADGGGITLKGTTDKTINWIDATDAWTFSEHVNIASAKEYRIAGTKVLDATSLGSAVTSSNLTSVGTIGTGVWNGTTIAPGYGGTGQTSYTDGQLLIGKTDGTLAKATLTASTGVSITNGDGTITISATGSGGTVTAVTGTSPIASTGGTTPDISIQDGTTTQKGAVQLEDSTSSTSTTTAATPNSVKSAYDLANAALPKAGGTMTGDITFNAGQSFPGTFSSAGGALTGNVTLNAQSDLRFADSDSSNWVAFEAPATIASNITWTLPSADGTTGQVLSTDGSGTLSWATAGGGGLTHFVESENTSTPNATIPVDALTATDASYTNIDVAYVAKGTGATLAQIPNNATSGGAKRGNYATDLQKQRSSSAQVASGANSVIVGGLNNTASASSSVVGGGSTNIASGSSSTVSGGELNTASGTWSAVNGGYLNTASATFAFVFGAGSGTASATHSVIAGGRLNTADANYSFVGGGNQGRTRGIIGYTVFPACFAPITDSAGVSQTARLVLGTQTTSATATTLTSDGGSAAASNQVTLPNNSAYSFSGEVIAGVTGAGNTARWTIAGAIKRGANAASTAMVGTATVTKTHNDTGAAAWTVAVTADTTRGAIKVEVTGAAATTIRWVCKIDTTEMTY
jgi:hypothetical protein